MADINCVVLKGRLVEDLELKHTTSGSPFLNGRICTETEFRRENGDWKGVPRFHSFTVWGGLAQRLAEDAGKGDLVTLTGRLQTRKYQDRDNQDRYVTEVVAESTALLRKKGAGQQNQGQSQSQGGQSGGYGGGYDAPSASTYNDDDIPF